LRLALRTQQIVCCETGAVDVADPLDGSYYMEWLTDKLEKEIVTIMDGYKDTIADKIVSDQLLHVLRAGAYSHQKEVENGEPRLVGVNCFAVPDKEEGEAEVCRADQEA